MSDYSVHHVGTDVYGRNVYMTAYYRDWEQARWDALGFRLKYAQGCFMADHGGGANASSGAHDKAGCIDYDLEGISDEKSAAVVWEFRTHGGAANRRGPDAKHGGMPKHLHNTLGTDRPLAPMAQTLWDSYLSGGDGLAGAAGRPSGAPDYERRPSPLVLTPPEEDMNTDQLLDALESPRGQAALAKAVLKAKVKTNDAPNGRYLDTILASLFNHQTKG